MKGSFSRRADAAAGKRYHELIAQAEPFDAIRTAVVHPVDSASLLGALEAQSAGLIQPVLIGPQPRIEAAAKETDADLSGVEIVNVEHSGAAAEKAVELARAARVDAIMKGALHTDELMRPVVDKARGLRTDRRISHVFALDVPSYPKHLFITDAAINIAPDLEDKRDIVQNAIDLALALRIAQPPFCIDAHTGVHFEKDWKQFSDQTGLEPSGNTKAVSGIAG